MLNQELIHQQQPKVNHKRVYRIMKQINCSCPPMAKDQAEPTTEKLLRLKAIYVGAQIVLPSSVPMESECMSLSSWIVREILSYIASTVGINGESIRDLMLEAMEYRFGTVNLLPHKIQWISDNGPCYVTKETVSFAKSLGFDVCTTAPYSPESNGMAEAFVKTFKRDYVAFYEPFNPYDFMQQLPVWFNNYNENAPHKGLNMMSPRQFLIANVR